MASKTKISVGSMKITAAPSRFSEVYSSTDKIKQYGDGNLYPQILVRLIQASPTASICCRQYCDFIFGEGIEGGDDIMVNDSQTLNDLVYDMAHSEGRFAGFPLHISYNALMDISAIRCLPMETIRMGEDDSLGYVSQYVYCPDWAREKTRNKKQIDPKTDKVIYKAYSDVKAVNAQRCAEVGLENYLGEILYVSNRNGYPLPLGDAVLTDMSTEEGLCNITYRNARCNFLTAGVLVIPKGVAPDGEGDKVEEDSLAANIQQVQGDANTGKILTYEVQDMSTDKPEFLDFKAQNFDKEFEVSNSAVVERIYSAFKQDLFYTIRIGKLGFSGDVMADAYALMNVKVRGERAIIERTLKRLAKRMPQLQGVDLTIRPLIYNSATGQVGLTNNNPTA